MLKGEEHKERRNELDNPERKHPHSSSPVNMLWRSFSKDYGDPEISIHPRYDVVGSLDYDSDLVNSIEEGKMKGIITLLTNERMIPSKRKISLTRTTSYDSLDNLNHDGPRTQRGSLDNLLEKRMFTWTTSENSGSMESSKEVEENTDDKMHGTEYDVSGSRVTNELDFQTSLKNERYHFIFAEMLIEGLETMHSEEFFLQNKHGEHFRVGYTLGLDKSYSASARVNTALDCHVSYTNTFSNVKITTMGFLDHIMALLTKLNAHDTRCRELTTGLKSLLDTLENNSFLSFSLDNLSVGRKYLDKHLRLSSSARHLESPSEDTEDKIRSVIDTFSTDLQVGSYPVLGPDMSLPGYVASRSPPPAKRAATLFLQQNKCPGCKCSFLPEVAIRLRLCRYFGLYFCSVCHSNTLMLLPARILTKWDFSMYPVSRPARDLLHHIHGLPLFTLSHFSKSVQGSVHVLETCSRLRRQGRLMLDFIANCRQGAQLTVLASNLPGHWFCDPPLLFSIADFQMLDSGSMDSHLRGVVSKYMDHISLCSLCQARGFFCELCDDRAHIIFPFQIDLVSQCSSCGSCFHAKCYSQSKSPSCPRCERRRLRDQRLQDQEPLDLVISS